MPVARRAYGESHQVTFGMKVFYAMALYQDAAATLDDLREAVAIYEELEPIARRVFGGQHAFLSAIEQELPLARAALHARESSAPPPGTAQVS